MTELYIIESIVNGRFYIGVTDNVIERISAHNAGYNKSTKAYRPYKQIFSISFETKSLAMKQERKLKNLKSRKKILDWINKVNKGSIPEN